MQIVTLNTEEYSKASYLVGAATLSKSTVSEPFLLYRKEQGQVAVPMEPGVRYLLEAWRDGPVVKTRLSKVVP